MDSHRVLELAGLINEASLPSAAFVRQGDHSHPQVWFRTTRKEPKRGIGVYYVLVNDGWFRMDHGSGEGYGLMIRSIKINKRVEARHDNYGKNPYTEYKAFIQYLPSSFDDWDDDKSSNYEKMWVTLFIKDGLNIGPEDVEAYVRSEMHKWRP